MPPWFDELSEFLRIPSVSADPAHAGDVAAAGSWVCDLIRDAGGSAELVDWHGQPLAIGELRASRDPEHAPTVLCYGHFDVQPPDPLELWDSAPFEPEIRGEYLYGRGVADDKGQLYLLLSAARELARAGELPVNVRFACDGEEETGGNSILEFLAADDRGADAAVIFDTGMVARGVPAFNIATRGLVYFHLTLRSGARDLHSGIYGGAAMNAAHALDADAGRRHRPRRPARRAAARRDPPADAGRARRLARAAVRRRRAGRPGRAAGGRPRRRGVLHPHVRRARPGHQRLRRRLAVSAEDRAAGQGRRQRLDPTGTRPGSRHDRRGVRAARPRAPPPTAPSSRSSGGRRPRPGLVDPDSRAITLGLDAFERALGVRPLLIRSGGTLPIVPALAAHGIPAIITGFSLPDANIHSPNERMLVEYIDLGIVASKALLTEFAAL